MPHDEDELGGETNLIQPLSFTHAPDVDSSDRYESLGAADEAIESTRSESARPQDIRIDRKDRVIGAAVFHDSCAIRAGVIIGVVIALMGLAWIFRSSLNPNHIPSSPSVQITGSSAAIPAAKGDRFQSVGNAVHEGFGEASANDKPDHFSSSTSSRAKPSLREARPSPSTIRHSSGLQRHAGVTRLNGKEASDVTKIAPVPETRPTTIDGWTVREVTNGLAAVEGPNGIWTVRRGDAVPGLGRIDSIVLWGRRWIVATSQDLISTP